MLQRWTESSTSWKSPTGVRPLCLRASSNQRLSRKPEVPARPRQGSLPAETASAPPEHHDCMNTRDHTAAQRHLSLSRRHFLRGLGACIALPAFESLAPFKMLAAPTAGQLATTATGAPLRAA